MNNKLLISKVFSKYRGSEGIYPLRKYSAYLLHGSPKKCRRVSVLIKNALDDEASSELTPKIIFEKMRSLEELQDTEIHLFAYALTREVFLALLNEKLPLQKGISLLAGLEELDMDEIYSRLSEVNRILLSKNPHHYRISDEATRRHIRERIYRYARQHKISEIEGAKIYTSEKGSCPHAVSRVLFPILLGLTALFSLPVIFLLGIILLQHTQPEHAWSYRDGW